ncbi:MAG: autotransporter domain-containing protein, partial [Pseudomonadota bacterium]
MTSTQGFSSVDLVITTTPGFSVDTTGTGGDAFSLDATNSLTFDDQNASTISGATVGIDATNTGTGALSITATGDVTGIAGAGISAEQQDSFATGDVTISATNVTGGSNGITTTNSGYGGLSISADNVAGGGFGIEATDYGNGTLSIITTGTVSGQANDGIFAYKSLATSGDVTISAGSVSGGDDGVYASNRGTGGLSVTTTGDVTATNNDGVRVYQGLYGTGDVVISTANVTGGFGGIDADNLGTGSLTITATGDVVGTAEIGILAKQENGTSTGDLTISAGNVTGGGYGLYVENRTQGAIAITTTGAVTGGNYDGIELVQFSNTSGSVSLNVVDVSGGRNGIDATNSGAGATSIISTGSVSGATEDGINLLQSNSAATGDVTLNVVNVNGNEDGIEVINSGGALTITSTGTVIGVTDDGIQATQTTATEDNLTISVDTVSAGRRGISAYTGAAGGDISITATGDVTSTNGDGINAYASIYSDSNIVLNVNNVSGGDSGIRATNYTNDLNGTVGDFGGISITATGDVTGTGSAFPDSGIYTYQSSYTTGDLVLDVGNVSGGYTGISSSNSGSGNISITSNGAINGADSTGVFARAGNTNSQNVAIDVVDASGNGANGDGIFVSRYNAATTTIDVSGDVSGDRHGVYLTIEANSGAGNSVNIVTIEEGASVTGNTTAITDLVIGGDAMETTVVTSGDIVGDVVLADGDDAFEFRTTASVAGVVFGGADDDAFLFAGNSRVPGIDATFDLSGVDFNNDGTLPSTAPGITGVTGFESFSKVDSSFYEFTGANIEAGLLDFDEGGLVVTGTFGGLVMDAAPGTFLGGTGTIGELVAEGTIEPGAFGGGIGTLTVLGDATLGAGVSFNVEVADDGSTSDRLAVTGAATVDFITVNASLVGVPSNLPDSGSFTVISADGGVTGQFGALNDNIPDIVLTAEYLPNEINLVYTVANNPDDMSEKAISSAALRGAIEANRLFAVALRAQSENCGWDLGTDTFAPDAPRRLDDDTIACTFGGVFGGDLDVEDDGPLVGFDTETIGFYIGGAATFVGETSTLRTGLALGYSWTDSNVRDSDGDGETFHVGIFAEYERGPLRAEGSLTYGDIDFDLSRSLGSGVTATGDADGDAIALSTEISYDIA